MAGWEGWPGIDVRLDGLCIDRQWLVFGGRGGLLYGTVGGGGLKRWTLFGLWDLGFHSTLTFRQEPQANQVDSPGYLCR